MQLPSNAWHIPHSPKQCANLNHTVSCNFGLYSNATNLSENEKLAPNPDLTGNLVGISTVTDSCAVLTGYTDFQVLHYHGFHLPESVSRSLFGQDPLSMHERQPKLARNERLVSADAPYRRNTPSGR